MSNSNSNTIPFSFSSQLLSTVLSDLSIQAHVNSLPGGFFETKVKSIIKEVGQESLMEEVSIIAMKGPPFTRKTEFATLIATSLGCPVFSLEHFLVHHKPPSSHEAEDQAFRTICTMAKHHLFSGVSKNVVIDSPLSSARHLSQLTEVASSLFPKQARVVIFECKPMNDYLWQMKFDDHLESHPSWAQEWFKPKSWECVEKASKVNGDYDERSVHGHNFVSKLVVDPLVDHPLDHLATSLYQVHKKPLATPRLIEAVKYMISRDPGDGPDVVVYNRCVKSFKKRMCHKDGHNIIPSSKVVGGLEHEPNCRACDKQIMRSNDIYTCKNCSLALHKECAEFFDSKNTWGSPFPKDRFSPKYRFPKEFACTSCRQDGKGFSDKCASCLFDTHLKCRLMPTIINHVDTEEHLLNIVLLPVMDEEFYRCVVCGQHDQFNLYLCKICGAAYHYKCVSLPRRMEHVHGGHHHHLSLEFMCEQAEDYLCNECLEKRDPGLWFYSCEECPYEIHPSCIDEKTV